MSESVYSAIGATAAPSRENFGHNNNLSFIIAEGGVMVVNGGDNALLAAALHDAIRELTSKPVRYVINENGQGHAFLGNSYWSDLGVPIIAQREAIEEIQAHGQNSLAQMRERMGPLVDDARVVVPGIAVDDRYLLELPGLRVELIRFGAAHSPGDLSVWLPEQRILIAGDIAFHERLLGIFPDSDVDAWIESFDVMADLKPAIVIPGHGGPTDIDTIRYFTQGYLEFLRDEIERILDEDGDLSDAYDIDQSAYSELDTFDELARKNAGRLFRQMEEKLW
ncbi:MBL fold metallo-hydrolase [Congregibacter brevis]|uniref:MBL fold metallo-hydrolase n=1 Tax=Congregibacter brevis TaxID=3081201 RepID=A0ABZ0IDL2_9GAMM|nr:MBL fold metallo-hydrolase [Congregibacter sp. IMCC45268]